MDLTPDDSSPRPSECGRVTCGGSREYAHAGRRTEAPAERKLAHTVLMLHPRGSNLASYGGERFEIVHEGSNGVGPRCRRRGNTLFQKEMTAFLSCISPDLSRETLIWVSLAIQPRAASRWQWKRLPCSPLLCVSHSLAFEPSCKPSWVWPIPGQGAFSVLSISASRPRRKHVNICVFTGVHLRGVRRVPV